METQPHVVYVDANEDRWSAVVSGVDATVERVETVDSCLERLEEADCVVYAGSVADGSGIEFCSRLRSRRVDVPIVLFPDDGSEALAGEALAAGAAGYVPQSQGVETLATRLDDILTDVGVRSPETSAERFELFIEQVPFAVIEWNLASEATTWNHAATDLFGYTVAEAAGKHAIELLVPESDRAAVRETWVSIIERGETDRTIARNRRKDGREITCEWTSTPLVDDDGEVVSVLSTARDVTNDRKRATTLEALQGTSRRLMRANSRVEIAEIVAEAVEDVIEQPRVTVRFATDDGRLRPAVLSDDLLESYGELPAIGPGDGLLWGVYDRQESAFVEKLTADQVPYELDAEIGNTVIHPLGRHGLLTVASPEGQPLDVNDTHLLTVLATTAEAALDRTERERELERAKTVIEAVGDSVYALDEDGRFVTVNDTLTAITGYDREELLGEPASMVLTPDSVERGLYEVRSLYMTDDENVVTYEVELRGRSGTTIPCEVTTSLLRSDGEFAGTVGVIRDVSERKRMERELGARRRKIEKLHEIVSSLESCRTRQDVFELTAEAAEEVLNFDVCIVDRAVGDELVTVAVSSEIHAAGYTNRTSVDDGLAGQVYRTGETSRVDDLTTNDDATPQRDDYRSALTVPVANYGIFQAVSNEVGAFDDDDEELTELLLSHVIDALDRMAFESRLRTERDRFFALFENVPDAVVSVRQVEGTPVVERLNPAFEDVFGYTEAEIGGAPLDPFVVPADQRVEAARINQRACRGEVVETEVTRRTADGLREFMLRIVPMDTEEGPERTFGVYTDITERKQRQKRVEVLNRVLRHDLRNGMNIIGGYAETLEGAVDDDLARHVAPIQERATELIGLAETTRTVERQLERPAGGPIDIVDSVESAIDRVETAYPSADISRSLPADAFTRSAPLLPMAIHQVLENAVEHNDMPTPRVDVTLRTEDEAVVLRVADNGPTIPEDERAVVEEDEEITQLRHASGLGLWVVNWALTQSGGQLSFTENEPRGTVVRLLVPAVDPPA